MAQGAKVESFLFEIHRGGVFTDSSYSTVSKVMKELHNKLIVKVLNK